MPLPAIESRVGHGAFLLPMRADQAESVLFPFRQRRRKHGSAAHPVLLGEVRAGAEGDGIAQQHDLQRLFFALLRGVPKGRSVLRLPAQNGMADRGKALVIVRQAAGRALQRKAAAAKGDQRKAHGLLGQRVRPGTDKGAPGAQGEGFLPFEQKPGHPRHRKMAAGIAVEKAVDPARAGPIQSAHFRSSPISLRIRSMRERCSIESSISKVSSGVCRRSSRAARARRI